MNTISHVHTIPSEKQLKESAKAIKLALKELHHFEINYTQSLEISSRSYGFKNWNVAIASAKKSGATNKTISVQQEVSSSIDNFDYMSAVGRSIFMQTVQECAESIRLSHLDGITSVSENHTMTDTMIKSAVLLTYQRRKDAALLTDFVDALKDTAIPSSMSSVKEDILYVLSQKDNRLHINYYGMVVKSAEDAATTQKSSPVDIRSMGRVQRLHLMESHFESLGYPLLKTACKAIVGSNSNGTKLSNSIKEESMKESEGVWRSTWLPHKIIILQNEELFKKIAGDYGFDATEFIDKLNKELTKVEDFLSSSNPNIKNEQTEETAMKPIDRSLEILNVIDNIKPSSQGMHAYVNSLNKEDYALLATTFDLGRQGWERGYYETREYEDYVERMAANGEKVTREMADMKFLPKNKKQEQFDWLYQHMFKKSNKYDGAYEHNWLSMKTNLISETRKGIEMLRELM